MLNYLRITKCKSTAFTCLLVFLVLLLLWQYINIRRWKYKLSGEDFYLNGLDQDYFLYNLSDDDEPSKIKLLCWNIEGLENKHTLTDRTLAVCDVVEKEKPSIVFLQEVVPETVSLLRRNCQPYDVILGGDNHYFTAILLRKGHVRHEKMQRIPFPQSKMLRNLLVVQGTVKGFKMELLTSHLESYPEDREERLSQLNMAFHHMKAVEANRTVIFGGDLNLIDEEVPSIGGVPEGIFDVWEANGSSPDTRYTWDTEINDNLNFHGQRRFDRLYFRPSIPTQTLSIGEFQLVGTERLSCGQFPSDHFGILARFEKVSPPGNVSESSSTLDLK